MKSSSAYLHRRKAYRLCGEYFSSLLEAMMQAQNEKLNLIVEQLDDLKQALVNLQISINKLPDVITGLLRAQWRDELIGQISGAARRFATLSRTRIYDPDSIRTNTSVQELTDIMFVAQQNRATLAQREEGRGPEAAGIAALALGLEIACLGLLNADRARMLAALDDYAEWIHSMRSEERGSIWQIAKDCAKSHDDLMDQLSKTEIGRNFAFEEAKLGSSASDIAGGVRNPCVVLCPAPVIPNPAYASTTKLADDLRAVCPVGWGAERKLMTYEEPQLQVRLLFLEQKWEGVMAPMKGDLCITQEIVPWSNSIGTDFNNGKLTAASIKKQTETNRKKFDNGRAQFEAGIAQANYYRARAGQCAIAFDILARVEHQAQLYRGLLV